MDPKHVIEVRENDTYLEVYDDFVKLVQKNEDGYMTNVNLTNEELFSITQQIEKGDNKLKLQVYDNGEFIKDEIDWIEKTDETLQEYINKTYDWEEPWMFEKNYISEEDINGLCEIAALEKGYEKYIRVYQHFEKYDYFVSIDYGEMTYCEWYACKDFKTLLAFLKELEPLLNLMEQRETLGNLEVILDEFATISNPETYSWMKEEKYILRNMLQGFEHIDDVLKEWIQKTKRRKFMMNDMCKEIIKVNKQAQEKA